ncbi:hypothetical protein MASR1M8_20850 [Thermomonas brevis]
MSDPITNAKIEHKRLEGELEAIRAKLNKVAAFIEMYNEFAGKTAPAVPAPRPARKPDTAKRLTIPDRVAAILSDGVPRKPHVLLSMLEAEEGKPIGMGDEGRRITNLSSQLSRDKARFKSNRAIGWSLVQQSLPQMENPSSVGADDGFDD